MPRQTFAELIVEIDTMSTNLRSRLGELPLLTPLQTDLEAWLAEARSLESQQEVYTARLRETNEKRRLAETRGIELRGRAANGLRSHFGLKSKSLHEFGVRPRRNPRPAAKAGQPAPQPEPVKAAAPAPSGTSSSSE
jgi:hypothetical protein